MPGVPGLQSYTSVAASNTTWFPEGMAPSAVNDGMRQVQADIRSAYVDSEWTNWGDTPSRASNSTFKITTDVTSRYLVNRRIKCYDAATIYGVVTASSYSAPDTTVTVKTDSGNLSSSLSSVAIAALSPTSQSIPSAIGYKGSDVASASTINLSTCGGDFVDVTGTVTITAITSETGGIERVVRFTGALTLTHNGTSLILPGAANITTAANDRATFRSLGSGNWICIHYTKADGTPVAGAPADPQYVTLATNGTLTSERVLTAGNGITLTDAGAGSTVTVAMSSWVKIGATQTASSSASIAFTGLSSTYRRYQVILHRIVSATDGVVLWMRTSTDGGSTYDSGAASYNVDSINVTNASWGGAATATDTKILLTPAATYTVGNTAPNAVWGTVDIYQPSDAARCLISSDLSMLAANEVYAKCFHFGSRDTAADVDSIQFLMSSGNIASGTFTLYGLLA